MGYGLKMGGLYAVAMTASVGVDVIHVAPIGDRADPDLMRHDVNRAGAPIDNDLSIAFRDVGACPPETAFGRSLTAGQ
jgi:hypothetical protein